MPRPEISSGRKNPISRQEIMALMVIIQEFREEMNQCCDGFIKDFRKDRRSRALPGHQASLEGKDAYNAELVESKDDLSQTVK